MSDCNHYSILLIVDRSASVFPFRRKMLRGLRRLVADQAKADGLTTMSVVEFDSEIEIRQVMESPQNVDFGLRPNGKTALYDAIGFGILRVQNAISDLPEHARPWGVQVLVITDGEENASREFSLEAVRTLVRRQRKMSGWRFTLVAANQDSNLTGSVLGFGDSNFEFTPSSEGVTSMARDLSAHLSATRSRPVGKSPTQS